MTLTTSTKKLVGSVESLTAWNFSVIVCPAYAERSSVEALHDPVVEALL